MKIIEIILFLIALCVVMFCFVLAMAEPVEINDGALNLNWSAVDGCNGYALVFKDLQGEIIGYWIHTENLFYDFYYFQEIDIPTEVFLSIYGCVLEKVDDLTYRILEASPPEVYHYNLIPNPILQAPLDVVGE